MYLVSQGAPVSPDFSWAGASEWTEKLIINRRRWSPGAHRRQLFRVVGRDVRVAQVVTESLDAPHHSRRQKTPMETLTQQFHSDRTRMDSKGSESLRLKFLHDFAPRLGFDVKRHPRLSRLTRFYDLLAGRKPDSFLLIRCRPRDPVCV
jgi:hypothetical protein